MAGIGKCNCWNTIRQIGITKKKYKGMSEWKCYKLNEISSLSNGINFDKSAYTSGVKLIGVSDFKNRIHPDYDSLQEVDSKVVKSGDYLEQGDIVFVRSNGNKELVGRCMMIDRDIPVTYSGFCIKLRLKDKKRFEPVFFNYLFRTRQFKNSMTGTAVGANIQNLSQSRLGNCEVKVPNIETQHRIATILSRYDLLIENYQKQIKLLEEAAQRLYKEWFVDLHFPGHENTKIVDGVPEGWEKKPISQLGEYLNGFAFKPSDWQDSGKPIIKIKEMGNGVSNDTPRNNGERVPVKYLVKAGDLLFSWSATLMVIVWSGEEGWLNQHLFKVTPAKGIGREFLLQSISNTIEVFQNLTTGSTMKHIQRNKLDQVFVNVPNDEIMKLYSSIAEKEREEILHLSSQIRLLTEARDRLLPKLMSGEIAV